MSSARHLWFIGMALLFFLSCEGKEGPTGPQGPSGEPGEKPEHVKESFYLGVYFADYIEEDSYGYVMTDTLAIELDSQFLTRWSSRARYREAFPDFLIMAHLDTSEVTRRRLGLPPERGFGSLYLQPYSFQDTDVYYIPQPLKSMVTLPDPDQLIQEPIILEENDSFVIHTREDRWAFRRFPLSSPS